MAHNCTCTRCTKKACSGWGPVVFKCKVAQMEAFFGVAFLTAAKIHKVTCQCLFKSHSSGDAELTLDEKIFPHRDKKKKKRNVSESHARKAVNYSPDPSE